MFERKKQKNRIFPVDLAAAALDAGDRGDLGSGAAVNGSVGYRAGAAVPTVRTYTLELPTKCREFFTTFREGAYQFLLFFEWFYNN